MNFGAGTTISSAYAERYSTILFLSVSFPRIIYYIDVNLKTKRAIETNTHTKRKLKKEQKVNEQ